MVYMPPKGLLVLLVQKDNQVYKVLPEQLVVEV